MYIFEPPVDPLEMLHGPLGVQWTLFGNHCSRGGLIYELNVR